MIETEEFEEFAKIRLTSKFCKCDITDDKFVMMNDPRFPNDLTKQLYFHSKGRCDPTHRYIKEARGLWLFRYSNP